METQSDWCRRVETEIDQYRHTLGEKGARKYQLDLLRRVARRVDSFGVCPECQDSREQISGLARELSVLTQLPTRQARKSYHQALRRLVAHLKKAHRLVDKGYYTGVGASIGTALGVVIGVAFSEAGGPAIGTGAGMAIGVAVGYYLDRKAAREGRVI